MKGAEDQADRRSRRAILDIDKPAATDAHLLGERHLIKPFCLPPFADGGSEIARRPNVHELFKCKKLHMPE